MPDAWFVNLSIEIEKLNATAFSIFGIEIKWYAICILTGVLLGLLFVTKEAKRTGQNPNHYSDYLNFALIIGIIGARLYYVAFEWDSYKSDLLGIINIRNGGLAIIGGIIAASLYSIYFTKSKKINLLLFLDTYAPALAIGQAVGRWGNFFNKEAFGNYTNTLFALRYKLDQVHPSNLTKEIMDNLVTVSDVSYIQVHPTFLYESIWNFFVFISLAIMLRYKKFSGQIMASYFLLYGIGRFFIESLRTDQLKISNTDIAISQLLSLVFVIFSLAFLIRNIVKLKKSKKK